VHPSLFPFSDVTIWEGSRPARFESIRHTSLVSNRSSYKDENNAFYIPLFQCEITPMRVVVEVNFASSSSCPNRGEVPPGQPFPFPCIPPETPLRAEATSRPVLLRQVGAFNLVGTFFPWSFDPPGFVRRSVSELPFCRGVSCFAHQTLGQKYPFPFEAFNLVSTSGTPGIVRTISRLLVPLVA